MIQEKRNGHVLELTIATNELNTLDSDAFHALNQSLRNVKEDNSIKTILLTGSGEKFFSNGFEPTMFLGKSYDEIKAALQPVMDATSELLMYPKPVVCLINGHCMGVGSVVAIFTDYRIMIDGKVRFGFPESQIGINFPSIPGYVLKELVGSRNARQILYSGKPWKTREALELGLVDEVVSREDASKAAEKYCNQFKDMAMESVIGIKKSLIDYMVPVLTDLAREDTELLARAVASANGQEGMRSIIERRRPVFQ
jgi:enoyl-CoA hydratase